ncbi:MAG: DUF3656 domain-containing protein [bacterium]|nr:DUF3656 domain-containing protein [bacterium]MDY4108522.1 DUF3656 domain-containing protein [Bacilli bacterium]
MKKVELLAPAGNMENLKYAVMAGCDAVYLGLKKFGARAFSSNFSDNEFIEAVNYCHLYGVKVYVTLNTIIYDYEVEDFLKTVDFIHKNNVDAVLIQDLGMLDLVRKTYPNLEVHASTQMHIHNLDGVKVLEKLGIKRAVLARETSIDTIKYIKENSNIELEVFVHGALCVSYSGECLMSKFIGGRSGNRGECAGACRLSYDVVDCNNNILNKNKYPISTKDLNTIYYIDKLIESGVASLKIEGRMKSKEYVYMVVKLYRDTIDNYYKTGKVIVNEEYLLKLKKIFNREYTKGFLFNINNNELINSYRPNHMGVNVGKVLNYKNGYATILLTDHVSIGSGLRVLSKNNKDVGILVNEFYKNNKLVKDAYKNDIISIKVHDKVFKDDIVVITNDKSISNDIEDYVKNNKRKVLISGKVSCKLGIITLEVSDGINKVVVSSNNVFKSINKSTTKEDISVKLNKLVNTVYKFNSLDINIDSNLFIPLKEINGLKNNMVVLLNDKRLYKINYVKSKYYIDLPDFKKEELITCYTNNINNLDKKYDIVYTDKNCLPRVVDKYENYNNVMIGELGGFNKCSNVTTDVSFNVVNSYAVAFLHSMGASCVTLSYEMTDTDIENLVNSYINRYNKRPNLELIVYGYTVIMCSKYSLNKEYNKNILYLKDRFNNKFRVITKNNIMYIYFYNKIDKYDKKYYEMGINRLRFNLD